jgi:hypothetical protein
MSMTAIIPFPAFAANAACDRGRRASAVSQVIDLQARRAQRAATRNPRRSGLPEEKVGSEPATGTGPKKLRGADFAALLCLAAVIVGIFGALSLSVPRPVNPDPMDTVGEPFARPHFHRA